jgi:hypothetical protein
MFLFSANHILLWMACGVLGLLAAAIILAEPRAHPAALTHSFLATPTLSARKDHLEKRPEIRAIPVAGIVSEEPIEKVRSR